ncbi:MAG: flagellar motor switch protein FliG [Myxococcota bacterium]
MATKPAYPKKRGGKRNGARRGKGDGDNGRAQTEPEVKLKGAQRAALFLLSLQEDTAAQVFRHLERDEIRKIMNAMRQMHNVPTKAIKDVFDTFSYFVQHEPVMLEGGADYLRGALDRALGREEARLLLGEVVVRDEPDTPKLERLSSVDPSALANVLETEHPQTIALVLVNLEADHASRVLARMDGELQDRVMNRIARLERVNPMVIKDIEASLLAELQGLAGEDEQEIKGVVQAAALLNNMERKVGVELLGRLEEADDALASKIRDSMFTFDDLSGVDDRGMQAILKEVSTDDLIIALKTANEDLKATIFRNMSSRAAQMMADDLEAMGPVRLAEVEEAQKKIAAVALRLQEEGTIVIAGAGEDVV